MIQEGRRVGWRELSRAPSGLESPLTLYRRAQLEAALLRNGNQGFAIPCRIGSSSAKMLGSMRIITRRKLVEFWTRSHSDAKQPLIEWHQKTEAASWTMLPDVLRTFGNADQVGRLTVFNIKGNDYRLVVRIEYRLHLVFIRWLGTHDEYHRGDWKNDSWY